MSSDNGIYIINSSGKYKVHYFHGECASEEGSFKTLEEAVVKAKEIEKRVGETEYGTKFIDK